MKVPGHDIGVMLHHRNNNFVALANGHAAERARHQVDRLGGVAGKDDLLGSRGIEKAPHGLARILEAGGRGVGKIVQAAMHVCIFHLIGMLDGFQHRTRFLRRGPVVEIDERLAVHLTEKNGKIRSGWSPTS